MVDGTHSADDRAISEMASVLTLVALALVIVLAIGASVLFFQPQSPHPEAGFSFEYFDSASTLLVTHTGGDEIPAGDLLIRGPSNQVTWNEINSNMNESTLVGVDDAIQIGRQNVYNEPVAASDRIAVVYVNNTANQTAVLAQWNGTGI